MIAIVDAVGSVDPRLAFRLLDADRAVRRRIATLVAELRLLLRRAEGLRLANPVLFDQLVVAVAFGVVDLVVSYLKRREA